MVSTTTDIKTIGVVKTTNVVKTTSLHVDTTVRVRTTLVVKCAHPVPLHRMWTRRGVHVRHCGPSTPRVSRPRKFKAHGGLFALAH